MSHAQLWMVRHGEVAPEWAGRIYGDLDVPLSARGEAQSRAVAAALADVPFAAVVSSGLSRAEYAAAALRAGRGLARRDDRRLAEIFRGEWAGRSWAEVAALDPPLAAHLRASGGAGQAPGGETLHQVRERVLAALDELARAHSGSHVAIVAHRWVLAVAMSRAIDLPLERCGVLELTHAALVRLWWPAAGESSGGGGPKLVGFAADLVP